MIDIAEDLKKIENTIFFSRMGVSDINDDRVILIEDVRKVFIEPSDVEFKGFYKKTKWLPTSPTQEDPFYGKQSNPKDLLELRKEVNKCVMNATKDINKSSFISQPHDFSIAARNAICFAFRQSLTERYFKLGSKWEMIVDLYYLGHWPVGYAKDKIIVI
ncbi:hypothetical protein [Mangrovibacter phragmitis]|uniref:hypothetical protein n=1 Tax=Mangrovibacter phragmitis TaxID=1691903 RepID=UPI003514FA72